MRWLINLLLFLFALAVFVLALLFVMANPEPVAVDMLFADWQPVVGLGQAVIGVLLVGLVAGFLLGLLISGVIRVRRRAR